MKRLSFLLGLLLICGGLAAQKRVSGVVTDSKGEPVIGAQVTVKGTSISVITDVDGRFFLENVPEDAVKISVKSLGMTNVTRSIDTGKEMRIKLHKGEKAFTLFVQGGVGITTLSNGENAAPGFGYGVGAGFSWTPVGKSFCITPSVNFVQMNYTMKYSFEEDAWLTDSDIKLNPLYVKVPVMFEGKLWLSNSRKMVIGVGPYVAFGIAGEYDNGGLLPEAPDDPYQPSETSGLESGDKLFGGEAPLLKKTDAGVQLNLSYQSRRFDIGLEASCGLMTPFDGDYNNTAVEGTYNIQAMVKMGYRF